jgi:predicted dehydrogenase
VTDILVVGAGSIGSRHARNLAAAGASVTVTDIDQSRAAQVAGIPSMPFDAPWAGHDGIVIASPTSVHRTHAEAALATGAYVLIEKPLALPTDPVDGLLAANERIMVGFNLRLHRPVARAVGLVHEGRAGTPLAVRAWFGSWLPDWRPETDYRAAYSARADLGGGILLDAIHELDLLVWLLGTGELDVVGAIVSRVGPLEIDVEDTVKALLRTPTGVPVELSLDYLSRRYRRGLEVVGTEATVRLDWATGVIEVEDANDIEREPADAPIGASYELEASTFLAFVTGDAPAPVDARTGAASLELARRIQAAAR